MQLICVLLVLLSVCYPSAEQTPRGICVLQPTRYSSRRVSGTLTLSQQDNGFSLSGALTGLPPNSILGIHVHQNGHLSLDGMGSGGHWNPTNAPHDFPPNLPRHVGDMGNISTTNSGDVFVNKSSSDILWSLNGQFSAIGRSLVVHERHDTGAQPSGDAGNRIAQCVIGIAQPETGTNSAVADANQASFATCELKNASSQGINGRVTFALQSSGLILVQARICGLSPSSLHAIHVHQYGDLAGATIVANTGGHFNPTNQQHDYPMSPTRHVGDMGNLTVSDIGVGNYKMTLDLLSLTGVNSIIGRAVVVHNLNDKGPSNQPTGGAGDKIATCVIGITDSAISFDDLVCPTSPPSGGLSSSMIAIIALASAVAVLLGVLLGGLFMFALLNKYYVYANNEEKKKKHAVLHDTDNDI